MRVTIDPLILKYDRPVPRYTSYPTVPHWKGISLEEWKISLTRGLVGAPVSELSLYVHVPFCRSLCSFCGCTKIISRDSSRAKPFVDTLLRELDLKLAELRSLGPTTNFLLRELHLGGGTPTWLEPDALQDLLRGIKDRFANGDLPDISIEVDPRTCRREHVVVFREEGVHRVSLGVQDFHGETLRAIKREQPYEVVRDLVALLRENGITALNFDLVYGLPYQSESTIQQTIERVIELAPTRIALYSYAHIPTIKAAQKGVESHGLPDALTKTRLREAARERLRWAGYLEIGMDHFATPNDELSQVHAQGQLHRNFMGYTVQKTRLLLGLGPSSLSDSWFGFSQNEKDVASWQDKIAAGDITPVGGHLLSDDDLERRQVILDLMCRFRAPCREELARSVQGSSLAADSLVHWDKQKEELVVSDEGRPYIRNICATLDRHLMERTAGTPSFSRSI